MYIGTHAPVKYGYYNACKAVHVIGGNAIQIDFKNTNLSYFETNTILPNEDSKKCKNFVDNNNIYLINHSMHKINLARNPDENLYAIKSLNNPLEGKLKGTFYGYEMTKVTIKN